MLSETFRQIRACTVCAAELPLGPRPVVRGTEKAKLLIIGQAPGTRVHASGVPWDDRSGERLRDWLNMTPEQFYDEDNIAIMPMGFCYPGRVGGLPAEVETGSAVRQADQQKKLKGGDLPPRPECAPLWHQKMWAELPQIGLTLLVGQYAQKYYLGKARGKTLTATVGNFRTYLPQNYLPLPHPSWRTTGWQRKNPWFDEELLPALRQHVHTLLNRSDD